MLTTVGYLAERLGLRHNSVVELSNRCEEAGLILRAHDQPDRRSVVLLMTAKGREVLELLAIDHARELNELAPRLLRTLGKAEDPGRESGARGWGSGRGQGRTREEKSLKSEPSALRDFTVDRRVWLLSGVALVIGMGATVLAVLLLRLIAISTNLFYYHRFSAVSVSPAGSSLGHWMVVVPVVGGLLVGLMARFGSDKIRGHGIPEAIEAILLHRARVDAKVAILKPLSAAIAIGSGGPFGAEGPIIMTGGAFGSSDRAVDAGD